MCHIIVNKEDCDGAKASDLNGKFVINIESELPIKG